MIPPDPPLSDGGIVLRPMDERDVEAVERSSRDAEIKRWVGAQRGTAAEFLARKRRAWADGTAASFAVCDVANPDLCLGQVWVELDSEDRGLVGYWLLEEGRGSGRATRAVRLVTEWALDELRLARLALSTEPENAASQRVAERAGFQREGVLRSYVKRRDGTRADAVFYSLLPSDADTRHFAKPS
jgi:RimJ/RimL family protein N-acetyltransferase